LALRFDRQRQSFTVLAENPPEWDPDRPPTKGKLQSAFGALWAQTPTADDDGEGF
jgi:hypothetical protein